MPSPYTEFHPRWYRARVSTWWWLGRWPYLRFILRELTSLAVAYFVGLTLFQLHALSQGPAAYGRFQETLRLPWMLALHFVALLFVLYHTITWFNLAPKAMAVRLGGRRVPDLLVAAPNYVLWLAASAGLAWLLLRG